MRQTKMDMTPMPSKVLDDFFGPRETAGDRNKEAYKAYARSLQAGKADPREYYKRGNVATQHLAELWGRWTGIEAMQHNQFKCVAKLLTEFEDVEIIETAVQNLSRKGRVMAGIDMYYMRKLVENEVSRLKSQANKHDAFMEDFMREDGSGDTSVVCDRCGKETYHPDMDCNFH